MKQGSGDNPFDDQPSDDDQHDEDRSDGTPVQETEQTFEASADTDGEAESTTQIPFKLRRNKVKDGRDQIPFFLRKKVQKAETEFIDELEDRLDENVYKADAREVAVLLTYENHIDEAEQRLREWGYDFQNDT